MGKAVISDCGTFRYRLEREWPGERERRCLFIMLNPSTADAEKDDPTIRRCIGFAKREGCTSLAVVNLFAYRSTDPVWVWGAPDPIGPDNDCYTHSELLRADLVIAAWGAHGTPGAALERARHIRQYVGAKPVFCLGKTNVGAPRHPLYIRKDQPLEPFGWMSPKETKKDG